MHRLSAVRRSLWAKAGVEVDLGEKLRGEVGIGYEIATFDDDRLPDIDATVLDASVRLVEASGTDVDFWPADELCSHPPRRACRAMFPRDDGGHASAARQSRRNLPGRHNLA